MSAAQRRIHQVALKLFAEKDVREVNVSQLAEAAGVARGTIYNNLDSIESLFEQVAKTLSDEMIERVALSVPEQVPPAQRLALGIRYYVRRAHEEPNWGKFLLRYGLSSQALKTMWSGQPKRDLEAGLAEQVFDFQPEQLNAILAMIAGTVLTSMLQVMDGHRTWRDAGSDTAEMVLRAIGLPKGQARDMSKVALPELLLKEK